MLPLIDFGEVREPNVVADGVDLVIHFFEHASALAQRFAFRHFVAIPEWVPYLLPDDLSFVVDNPDPVPDVPVGPFPIVPKQLGILKLSLGQSSSLDWLDEDWLGAKSTTVGRTSAGRLSGDGGWTEWDLVAHRLLPTVVARQPGCTIGG
jgi:hypothetical protein